MGDRHSQRKDALSIDTNFRYLDFGRSWMMFSCCESIAGPTRTGGQ
jgi:hypothetical protein